MGTDVKWGQYPCPACDEMYDGNGQCGCVPKELATTVAGPAKKATKPKAAPRVARGFKGLKNVTVGGVIADTVNSVTLLDKNGKVYYVIEAEVVNGIPVMKCTKRKVVKYKRPDTSGGRLHEKVISKFA